MINMDYKVTNFKHYRAFSLIKNPKKAHFLEKNYLYWFLFVTLHLGNNKIGFKYLYNI